MAAPAANGSVTYSAPAEAATWQIPGVQAGQFYDMHVVATDASGNVQPNITTLR